MKGKEKSNWGIIFFVCLVIMFLGFFIFILCDYLDLNADNLKNKINKGSIDDMGNYRVLDGMESLSIGKELYDKANEIYSVWFLVPYCGYNIYKINSLDKVELGDYSIGNGMYYESSYADIEELKSSLAKWLSLDIINKKVNDNSIVFDLELLRNNNYSYTDYVIKDNKLYCRAQYDKEWLSNYLNKYTITVDSISNDSITYNISSSYAKNDASSKCLDDLTITSCTREEIELKDTKFVISKNETNKWVVTSFVLHD